MDFHTYEDELVHLPNRYTINILIKIPRSSREVSVRKLALVIEVAVAKNNQASWNRFLHFATYCLHAPNRGGHCWNMVREINELINAESEPPPVPLHIQPHPK